MGPPPDVLILGGGVIGLTTAYYLARAGASVALAERGELGRQASWAGAGILPPGGPGLAHTPFERLRAYSVGLYPDLSRWLREETGLDNGYLVCGGIEVPEPGDARPLPTEEWGAEGATFQVLGRADLARLAPDLAPCERAVYFPGMAQVRNPRHMAALAKGCIARGTHILTHLEARALVRRGSRIEAVETDKGRLSAGQVLVAAGAWADELLASVGWRPGVRPVRGQIALLNTGVEGTRPLLLQGKRYLVPRPDGRVLVGSTEEDAGFDARPTAGGIEGLLALASRLVPKLADAPLERCWAGLRPGSPDGLPYLGRVPGLDNLFVSAGHFRAGLQLSPASGLCMAELLLGRPTSVPLEAFRLDRGGAA
jgi:glycine oxidase